MAPKLNRVSDALRRLQRHMAGNGYQMAQDKQDITIWRENPLVIVELTMHTHCHECYGILTQICEAGGLHNVEYGSEKFTSRNAEVRNGG